MKEKEILCGLDIGVSKISVVLGEFKEPERLSIIKKAKVESEGLERGKVLDIEKFTQTVEKVMHMVGADKEFKPARIVLGIGNGDLMLQHCRRTIFISERAQEIKNFHIERLINDTLDNAIPFDHESLHIFPREFILDGQNGIKNPCGMFGSKLSADFLIITIPVSILYNLKKGVYNAGYEIDSVIFSGISSAFSFLNKEERTLGVVFLKIGGGITSIVKFREEKPVFLEIFPFGGIDIDYALSNALNISLEEAKELKEKYGSLDIKGDEKIILEKSDKEVSQIKVNKIIKDVVERFLFQIKRRLDKSRILENIPSGVIVGGDTFYIEGLIEKVEEVLHVPVKLGIIRNVEDLTGKENNLFTFSDPIGLLFFDYLYRTPKEIHKKPLNIFQKLRKLFEEYF